MFDPKSYSADRVSACTLIALFLALVLLIEPPLQVLAWAEELEPPDTTAPTTQISGLPSGWASAPVTFTLEATDTGSGVSASYYSVNGAAPSAYAGAPVSVSAPGTSTIAFWSTDVAGNVEATKTATACVDTTAPVTSCDATGTYVGSATIRLTAADTLSGVAATRYQVDSGGWTTGTVASVSTTGTHTLAYWSSDIAGNIEAAKSVSFTVVKPRINSLSAGEVFVGDTLTVKGTDFGSIPGTVTIGGISVPAASWTDTQVALVVPAYVNRGDVEITRQEISSNGVYFLPKARLTSLSSLWGEPGSQVTIEGTGFGDISDGKVMFGSVQAATLSWTPSRIVAIVPTEAPEGVNVMVARGWAASNLLWFRPIYQPRITSAPDHVHVGETLTVVGSHFGPAQATSRLTINGGTIAASSWSDTTITATVPATATSGYIGVSLNGITSNGVYTSVIHPTPAISTISTDIAPVDTTVTITGSNFGDTQGSGCVKFSGVTATVISWSDTCILVKVPDAPHGYVGVTQHGLTSTGPFFWVGVQPRITSAPDHVHIGETFAVVGSSFGAPEATSRLTINGGTIAASSWSDTTITATVPATATSGYIGVTRRGITSNGVYTSVIYPPPMISTISTLLAPPETTVTITGSNFGDTQGSSCVKFSGVTATVISWSDTCILVKVPEAPHGYVGVTRQGHTSNGLFFWVGIQPHIDSLSASMAFVGDTVTIYGADFGSEVGTVTLGGVPVPTTSWTPTAVTFVVPPDVPRGYVGVTVWRWGIGSNGIYFLPAARLYSLSASYGPPGSELSIEGTGFGDPLDGKVLFGDVQAQVVSWSPGQIVAIVPTEAPAGVYVGVMRGWANSNGLFFREMYQPEITTAPPLVYPSGTMTVTGNHLGSADAYTRITLAGVPLETSYWSDTTITASVPATATSGTVVVTRHTVSSAGTWVAVGEPDTVPPVTVAAGVPSHWTSATVTLSLAVEETQSGVAATYYQVNGGLPTRYLLPLLFSTEGTTTVAYWSVDGAGNSEAPRAATLLIDKTPPQVDWDAVARYTSTANIHLTGADTLSGVNLGFELDGVRGSGPSVVTTALGSHVLVAEATDPAGNTSRPRKRAFSVCPPPQTPPPSPLWHGNALGKLPGYDLAPAETGAGGSTADGFLGFNPNQDGFTSAKTFVVTSWANQGFGPLGYDLSSAWPGQDYTSYWQHLEWRSHSFTPWALAANSAYGAAHIRWPGLAYLDASYDHDIQWGHNWFSNTVSADFGIQKQPNGLWKYRMLLWTEAGNSPLVVRSGESTGLLTSGDLYWAPETAPTLYVANGPPSWNPWAYGHDGDYVFDVTYNNRLTSAWTGDPATVAAFVNGALPPPPSPPRNQWGPETKGGKATDPVDTSTGNFFTEATDLTLPGKGPAMAIDRTYNSQAAWERDPCPAARVLGRGWSYGYGTHLLVFDGGKPEAYSSGIPTLPVEGVGYDAVTVVYGDGRGVEFAKAADGSYETPKDCTERLTRNADGTWDLVFKNGSRNVYSATGLLQRQRDRAGNALELAYSGGLVSTVTAAGGRTFSFSYDSGLLSRVEDSAGRHVTYEHDAFENLLGATDAEGNTTHYTADSNHQMTSIASPLRPSDPYLRNVYSGDRMTEQTDGYGGVFTLTYHPAENETDVTDSEGDTVNFRYDSEGRLTGTKVPQSGDELTGQFWGAGGFKFSDTNGNGQQTLYGYDARGNVTSTTLPGGFTRRSFFDDEDRLLWSEDEADSRTTYAYEDTRTGAASITDPVRTRGFTYYPDGLLASSHVGEATTTYAYDDAGHLTSVTDPLGETSSLAYDLAGHLTTATDAQGRTSTFAYDALGHLTSLSDPLGNRSSFTYDGDGNQTSATDPLGNFTSYGYDIMDRLTSVTDAASSTTAYTYDPNYNLASVTSARSYTTSYAYDAADRLSAVTNPLGSSWEFLYDAGGNLMLTTNPDGSTVTRSYTGRDQLESLSLSGGPRYAYAYTPTGWLSNVTDDASHAWSLDYNPLGWLTAASDTNGSGEFAVSYAHDEAARVTEVRPSGEDTRTYTYNARGDLTQLALPTDPAGTHTAFAYDAARECTSVTLPNGAATAFAYDGAGRLATITSTIASASFTYARDAAGNVTSENGTRYTYDALSRLHEWYDPARDTTTTYTYDADYNLTTVTAGASIVATFAYDAAERIANPGFAYNANGDMTSDGTRTYAYDALSRLTSVRDASGTLIASYTYDFLNRRTSATDASGSTTYFHYDGGSANVIAETDAAGDTIASYAYDAAGRIHSMTRAGATYYYHANAHGDVVALTDEAGAVVATYRYDPWGKPLEATGSVENPYRYAGYRYDEATGLYYLWNRYYAPGWGRFLTRDAFPPRVRRPGTLNPYTYCLDNPTSLSDATGWRVDPNKWYLRSHPDEWNWRGEQLGTFFDLLPPQFGLPLGYLLGHVVFFYDMGKLKNGYATPIDLVWDIVMFIPYANTVGLYLDANQNLYERLSGRGSALYADDPPR